MPLSALFEVHCVTKPKTEAAPAKPHCSSEAVSPLSYRDVVRELESELWPYEPYPRCDRGQLLQVHAYWVAVPTQAAAHVLQPATHKPDLQDTALAPVALMAACGASPSPSSPPLSPRFACVVGIVWVRLSAAQTTRRHQLLPVGAAGGAVAARAACGQTQASVEGYLQVVLTHPHYRRRGLATWLLRQCLASAEAPAGIFASDTAGDGCAYRISRWHLHTLTASQTGMKPARRRLDGSPSQEEKSRAEQDRESIVTATLAMYRQLGFTERRYLNKYYAGQQDAVELVKDA